MVFNKDVLAVVRVIVGDGARPDDFAKGAGDELLLPIMSHKEGDTAGIIQVLLTTLLTRSKNITTGMCVTRAASMWRSGIPRLQATWIGVNRCTISR